MEELKPCPFCGGETIHDESCIVYIIESHTNFEQVYRDFPNFDYEKVWNTRASDNQTQHTHCCPCGAERTCKNVDDEGTPWFTCSNCGETTNTEWFCAGYGVGSYCPNCGAKVVS